jgi:sugar phosphate isomerase/epimerase
MSTLTLAHLTLSTTPEQTIDAAAAAGFAAVGLRICARRPNDPYAGESLLGRPDAARALARRAADAGIRLSNASAYQFYPDVGWDQVAPAIEATQALGMRSVVVNGFNPDEEAFTALFTKYCALAAQAHIAVALEFLPYSAVRSLADCLRVIEASGAPNAGVLLDALHMDRSGITPDAIASIPAGRIAFAQLCDAKKLSGPRSDAELLQEARTARLPAGEGELPLYGFLDALPPGLEIEYEVARSDLADATPLQKAQAAHADAERFMQAYASARQREA